MLERLRAALAARIAPRVERAAPSRRVPVRGPARAYAAAGGGRLTAGWVGSDSSADAELAAALRTMRGRSRALIRDASYAKQARRLVVNNVIGTGIGMQAQVRSTRNQLFARVNDEIESAWREWCRAGSCHTGGTLQFAALERQLMAQVFDAGEVFVRLHLRPFGDSQVPLALEVIEAERIADEFVIAGSGGGPARLGVECDDFGRPMAYWIRQRHPGDVGVYGSDRDALIRVPADQMIHLYVADRWPQRRGEPWLHTAARRLNDMDGYSEAEIVAARGAASYMGIIETPEPEGLPADENDQDGSATQYEAELEPGIIKRLAPGEKFASFDPSRPNAQMDPFMRMMLREVAAGAGVSYESLSRDYSQSNYSSSRLALLDDRDVWRVLQQWFVTAFREPLHRIWLQQAVLARAVPAVPADEYLLNPRKFDAVAFKPRGWSWVDPTKEVEAFKEAVRAGFTTVTDVVAQTAGGKDLEDVIAERRRELDAFQEAGIEVDTTFVPKAEAPAAAPPPAADDEPQDRHARVLHLRG